MLLYIIGKSRDSFYKYSISFITSNFIDNNVFYNVVNKFVYV